MYQSPLPMIGWAATLAVLAFAWWKGGSAERYGASLKLITSLVAFAVHHLLNQETISVALLVADGVLAVGFLILAIRYSSLWIGAAMLLQGGQFSLHAFYLVAELPRDRLYAIANNLVTLAILLCILAGTVIAWRARIRAQA
jgi:hypothetical protein